MNSPRRILAILLLALTSPGLLMSWIGSPISAQEPPSAGATPPVPQEPTAPDRPDILFIVIDDASYEDFEELDLPVYRALLSKARLYSNFYVSPLCSPSRYQMQFGRYPHRALIGEALKPHKDPGVPLADISIAEYLAAHGYATGLFGKWHLSGIGEPQAASEAARLQGYQTWQAGNSSNLTDHYNWPRIDDGKVSVCAEYSTLAVNGAFGSWWAKTAGPRFASVCYFAPHDPFQNAPPELDPSYTESKNPRRRFESALRGVDAAIGRILDQVDLSRTFVFLLSDNGTPANVRPAKDRSMGYKGSVYQGGIHVPLLVLGPGITAGTDRSLVQASDLPRTAIQLANLPLPTVGFEDSIDFSASFDGSQPGPRPWAFLQRFGPAGPAPELELHEWAVIRSDGYKLLWDQMGSGGVHELYFLPTDPFERKRLAEAEVTSALSGIKQSLLVAPWPY
jgi:arylsulfatase A-like enzyme